MGHQIPDLAALLGASIASDDKIVFRDTSAGQDKRVDFSELLLALVVQAANLGNNSIELAKMVTTSGDTTYSGNVMTNAVGLNGLAFTTTKANQKVLMFSETQTYGAPGQYRFYIDGVAVGAPNQLGYGPTTTYAIMHFDWATVASAGAHTLDLRISAAGHRVIHSEGSGKLYILAAH